MDTGRFLGQLTPKTMPAFCATAAKLFTPTADRVNDMVDKVNLTPKERREMKRRERYLHELGAKDWNREPIVTDQLVAEMPEYASRVIRFSRTWKHDDLRMVWVNTNHPDNTDWNNRRILLERLSKLNG